MSTDAEPAAAARQLLTTADRAVLSTMLARPAATGWPYGSLVLIAFDADLCPLLLLSDLADHSRNLKADSRLSLLIDGTAGFADPLAGPRLSLLGTAGRVAPAARQDSLARYVARHPSAGQYAGFADFHLYRMRPTAGHLVGGFGRIHWIPWAAIAAE